MVGRQREIEITRRERPGRRNVDPERAAKARGAVCSGMRVRVPVGSETGFSPPSVSPARAKLEWLAVETPTHRSASMRAPTPQSADRKPLRSGPSLRAARSPIRVRPGARHERASRRAPEREWICRCVRRSPKPPPWASCRQVPSRVPPAGSLHNRSSRFASRHGSGRRAIPTPGEARNPPVRPRPQPCSPPPHPLPKRRRTDRGCCAHPHR